MKTQEAACNIADEGTFSSLTIECINTCPYFDQLGHQVIENLRRLEAKTLSLMTC